MYIHENLHDDETYDYLQYLLLRHLNLIDIGASWYGASGIGLANPTSISGSI